MANVEWLAFGCPHLPIHDPDGLDWLVEQIEERKPQVLVCLGDMIDSDCLSSFAKSNLTALKREYESVNGFCERLNDAAPNARKVWLMGNHEQRAFRPEHAHLSELIDYRRHITAARRWKHMDYIYHPENAFTLGQVSFFHGRSVGQAACKREAIQMGVPYGLYVHAHTHRPHPVHRVSMGVTKLPYWHANSGTFIAPKPEYMLNKDDSLWGQGIVVGHAETKRRFDGKCNWSAQTIVRRMYWDDSVPGVMGEEVGVAA